MYTSATEFISELMSDQLHCIFVFHFDNYKILFIQLRGSFLLQNKTLLAHFISIIFHFSSQVKISKENYL